MVKVELNVGSFVSAYRDGIVKVMPKAVAILEKELKRLTPEDTKEMLSSYVKEVSSNEDSVIGEVGNTSKHAIYVEYGVEGRRYSYHKPKGSVFYEGVGNRTFARGVDNTRSQVLKTITTELGKL